MYDPLKSAVRTTEDIEDYEYVACSLTDCCKVCKALDGKTFKVKDMEPGENAPPMHPNCHCATAPYMDREEFDEWLDGYSEHGLTFEEWKNQSFKEESLRTKKNEDYSVDWKKIKSKEYTNRFSGISDNPKANALAAKRARNMLKHRDCADTEELYAISLTKGTDVSSILNQQYSRGVKRTEKFDADVRRSEAKGEQVLIMHNHPGDSIPSIADLNELFAHANAIGITVGHKGSLYLYTRPSRVLTDRDFAIASMKAKGYYYSKELPERVMTILSEEYDFVFKVL